MLTAIGLPLLLMLMGLVAAAGIVVAVLFRAQALKETLAAEVAARQAAERDLLTKQNLLHLITNSLPVGIAYVDAGQHYLFCNQVYARWLNNQPDNLVGHNLRKILGESIHESLREEFKEVLAGHPVESIRTVEVLGETRHLRVHRIPDTDAGGSTKGFVILASDISEQLQYQSDLLRAKTEADAASRAKSEFLANMSHEIRTPLGAILGFSELLISPEQGRGDHIKWAEAIKRNGDLLSAIIDDILDLSKVEAGKIDIERRRVFLGEALSDISSLLNPKAQEKGIALSISADAGVPAVIHTDPIRLRQILINIVGNAIKFTTRGNVHVHTKLIAEDEAEAKIAFVIEDSGPGIGREQIGSLFEPFSQADTSMKRRFGGTGLGLALSKRLAVLLGGDVCLTESTPGRGSTFTVVIGAGPIGGRVRERLDLHRDVSTKYPSVREEIRLDGLRVLLAEDTHDNRILVGRLLEMAGANVEIAVNGHDAICMAHQRCYDVVLMDIQMPELDGLEATRSLRSEGYATPIVALTAHALTEERDRCLDAGFNDHISKPVDRAVLLGVLSRYSADFLNTKFKPLH